MLSLSGAEHLPGSALSCRELLQETRLLHCFRAVSELRFNSGTDSSYGIRQITDRFYFLVKMYEFQNTHISVRSKYTYSVHAMRNPMVSKFVKAELTETEKSLNQNVSVILLNPKIRLFYETYEPL